jgi:hypothetical protein
MLINDSVTAATEVPIWLPEEDIAVLEDEHGIELTLRDGEAERTITGHFDFLQVRNGAVHILDYKPDARTNKPIAQLIFTRLPLLAACGGSSSSTSSVRGLTRRNTVSFFRGLFVRP